MPTVLRPELPPEVDEVFARVLAKRPDERYQSCREFVEAARMALGIFGPGTDSSLGIRPGPLTGSPPGGQPGAPADRFSWSSVPSQSQSHVGDPAGSAAAASYAQPGYRPGSSQPGSGQPGSSEPGSSEPGSSQPGGTLTSHRRQQGVAGPGEPGQPAGGQPPPGRPGGPRWYRRPRWLAVLAAVVLVAAGLGTWAGLSGSHPATMAMPPAKAKPKQTTSALMNALMVTNKSGDATGRLPPSTCKQHGSTMVTCTAPFVGISAVVFQTYPNLKALYAAYTAKVKSLNSGQVMENYQDCGLEQTVGEVGWNHQFQHPKTYTVMQMSMGMVTDNQAVGRVFCTFTQGLEYMVWTQDDGHLLAYAVGPVHEDVWNWWVAIHHNIGLAGAPMHM